MLSIGVPRKTDCIGTQGGGGDWGWGWPRAASCTLASFHCRSLLEYPSLTYSSVSGCLRIPLAFIYLTLSRRQTAIFLLYKSSEEVNQEEALLQGHCVHDSCFWYVFIITRTWDSKFAFMFFKESGCQCFLLKGSEGRSVSFLASCSGLKMCCLSSWNISIFL